jgi:uncharacterized membrane protein YgcG
MKRQLWLSLLLALVVAVVGTSQAARAQDKTLFWDRYDVNLNVQQNSDMLVEEIQKIEFTSGTFRFGFAAIPLDRVETITEVSMAEIIDGVERPYTPDFSGEYGFTTFINDNNELEITWYFPPTGHSQHTYVLRYRVSGGLRFYEEGDQLWWKAIPPDHNFPIRSSRVVARLPQVVPQDQLLVDSYGAPATVSFSPNGEVIFEALSIPAGEELEVRVQFPPGIVQGTPAAWQQSFDRRQTWGPVVGVIAGALALMLLIGGPVLLYLLWYTRGRDLPVGQVPEYITEPPSDRPAAIVGTLIDEQAEMKDIMAGIMDLAHRGALRLEEKEKKGRKGIGSGRDYIFHLEDPDKAIYPYEKKLLSRIFGKGDERRMRDLRNNFYTAIPELENQLYQQVVEEGLFTSNPHTTRQKWGCLGIFGVVVSVGLAFLLLVMLGDYSVLAACPALALAATAVSLIFVGRHMPRKTPKGAEEAAKWLAFKRYLETIEQQGDLEAVKDKFEEFLPYAVAFGLERRLIKKFAAINTPAPSWWGPVLVPRPMYHPYGYGTSGHLSGPEGGPPGPLAGSEAQLPSLDGMSDSIGGSLASMSDSLGSMLSSASSTLTSRPAPKSSSSSGGGWSGGGFSGGGGGGGGSRGFG